MLYLDPAALPSAALQNEGATTICDPEARQRDAAAGDTIVSCYDGTLLGLRALHTVVPRLDRVYLRRTICQTIPCSRSELAVVTVVGWVGETAWRVQIDWDRNTITIPVADSAARWPSEAPSTPPAVARPSIDDAPARVVERDPYPFCGEASEGPSDVAACFKAQALDGHSVEMIVRSDQTGFPSVIRFDGQGLITRQRKLDGGWFQDAGSMVLGVDESRWSLDNWLEAVPIA